MKFIPNYTVSYAGAFRQAGVAFDIDPKDRREMERHGVVEEKPVAENPIMEKPKKGRPKKVSE